MVIKSLNVKQSSKKVTVKINGENKEKINFVLFKKDYLEEELVNNFRNLIDICVLQCDVNVIKNEKVISFSCNNDELTFKNVMINDK